MTMEPKTIFTKKKEKRPTNAALCNEQQNLTLIKVDFKKLKLNQ